MSVKKTIADLSIEDHITYIENEQNYSPYDIDAWSIRRHVEQTGSSSIHGSEVRELVGLDNTPSLWGNIPPLPGYCGPSSRYFGVTIFPMKGATLEELEALIKQHGSNQEAALVRLLDTLKLCSEDLLDIRARISSLIAG